MTENGFSELTADGLRDYMNRQHENAYLLVDVRQPEEYTRGHIPGSRLLPVPELVRRMDELPTDRDLVFYCHSGSRSMAAALMTLDEAVTSGTIYNLSGGILAWNGRLLADYPRVQLFDPSAGMHDLLKTAMDLEKGAQRFYLAVCERADAAAVRDTFHALSKAEIGHARMIYTFWKAAETDPEPFDTLYDRLAGDILEGGMPLEKALARLAEAAPSACMPLIETALEIEHAAYDLYRNMADRSGDDDATRAFITIAQAEKKHMRLLVDAVPLCEQ